MQTIKAYDDILAKKPNNLSSVLQARKDFDRLMNDKFPGWENKFTGDNVRANAIHDIRKAVNDFVAGELPDGNKFKALLSEQSHMYDASKAIAKNAGAKGAIDKSTGGAVVGTTSYFGGGGAIATIITSPATYAALATYGTYKVGKTIFTAPMIRKALTDILRKTQRTLSTGEINALRNAINGLPIVVSGIPRESRLRKEQKSRLGKNLTKQEIK
jgi:hypothetical protein